MNIANMKRLILKKHGGEFVTFDDGMEHFEGTTPLQGRWLFFPPNKRPKTGMIRIVKRFQISARGTNLAALTMVKGLPPRDRAGDGPLNGVPIKLKKAQVKAQAARNR